MLFLFLFLFFFLFFLIVFCGQISLIDVYGLESEGHMTVPGLRVYSNDPGVDWFPKDDIYFLVSAVTGREYFALFEVMPGLTVERGCYFD